MARLVLYGAVRWCIGLGVALLAGAVVPSVALGSGDVGYQYLTTYEGTYTFTRHFMDAPNAPDGSDEAAVYQWLTYDYETITLHPDRSFTSRLDRYVLVRGQSRSQRVQGSDIPGGPFTSTTNCEIHSDRTPMVDTSGGPYIQPVLVKQNPKITVAWTLPEPTRQGNFHATCDSVNQGFSFPWTASEPGGTAFTSLPATQKMKDAFGSATTIRYSKIRNKPWTREFKNVTIAGQGSRPGFTGPATETAKVTVNSRVSFQRVYSSILPGAKSTTGNKLVDLLIDEGFLGLRAQGPPSGPPVGASGDPETVLVPGLGPGQLELDVHGTVVNNRSAHAAADAGALLASASVRVTRGGRPVTLTIVPTTFGHNLLSHPHGALSGRYVYGFRPRGSRRTYHAVEAFLIPAKA